MINNALTTTVTKRHISNYTLNSNICTVGFKSVTKNETSTLYFLVASWAADWNTQNNSINGKMQVDGLTCYLAKRFASYDS